MRHLLIWSRGWVESGMNFPRSAGGEHFSALNDINFNADVKLLSSGWICAHAEAGGEHRPPRLHVPPAQSTDATPGVGRFKFAFLWMPGFLRTPILLQRVSFPPQMFLLKVTSDPCREQGTQFPEWLFFFFLCSPSDTRTKPLSEWGAGPEVGSCFLGPSGDPPRTQLPELAWAGGAGCLETSEWIGQFLRPVLMNSVFAPN